MLKRRSILFHIDETAQTDICSALDANLKCPQVIQLYEKLRTNDLFRGLIQKEV